MRVRLKTEEPVPPVLWFTFAAIFLLGGAIAIVTRRDPTTGVIYCLIGLSYVLDIIKPRIAQWFFTLSLAALLVVGVRQVIAGRLAFGIFNVVLAILFLILLIQRLRHERPTVPEDSVPQ